MSTKRAGRTANRKPTAGPGAPRPDLSEKAAVSASLDLFSRYGIEMKADGELEIADYREMMTDPQIRAAVMFKILARISSGWDIVAASDKPQDVEAKEFVEANLKRMRGTMSGFLRRAMMAMAYGLSVHEMVLEIPDKGPLAGKICLKELKWKRPEHFRLKTDKFGNLIGVQQKLLNQWQDLDPLYFVTWAWDHEGDYQGRSDLTPAYRWFKSKKLIDWVWNVFLEKHATPTPVGKFPPGATSDQKNEVLRFLQDMPVRGAAIVPANWQLDNFESGRTGGDYEQKIKYSDRMIVRSLLLPTLVLDEGDSGAYALGQQHADTFTWVLDAMGEELAEDIMQDQVIRRLCEFNLPDLEELPRFVWRPYDAIDLEKISKALQLLITAKIISPRESWIREKLDLPPADTVDMDDPLEDPEPDPAEPKVPDDPKDQKDKKAGDQEPVNLSARAIRQKHRAPEIKARMTAAEDDVVRQLAASTQSMFSRLIQTLRKTRMVENRDHAAVAAIKLGSVGDIRRALEKGFGDSLHWGVSDAIDEVRRGLESTGRTMPELKPSMGINLRSWVPEPWTAPEEVLLSSAEIIAFWESKVPVQKALLSEYVREAFTMSGVYQDDLLVGAQRIIGKGIRRGAATTQVESELAAYFRPYLEIEGALSPALASAYRIETVVRTAMAEAYNTGRMNLFRDPAVMDFIVAYQYSAVMDNRTTPFCEDWHDAVILANDPALDQITPPNHYRCRSILIPITRGEAFDMPEALPDVRPADGFMFRSVPWA